MVIKESPALKRRKLIDMMISQIGTSYFIALQKYNKVLEQKNALLRNYRFNGYFEENCMMFIMNNFVNMDLKLYKTEENI